jgi:hypothetical protein
VRSERLAVSREGQVIHKGTHFAYPRICGEGMQNGPALGNVHAEDACDLRHCAVHPTGQAAHASCCGESDQSDDQHILHDPLTGFIIVKPYQQIFELIYHAHYIPLQ